MTVRVVDFAPWRLQDFAKWRKKTDYDALSDYSGNDLDSEDDSNTGTLDLYRGEKLWEWRFALQLEEVNPEQPDKEPARLWAMVDNIEGQHLTNLNACE